jgi:hypothetical protein
MPVADVPLQVRRRCEAPHPSRFGLCQPGGVVQEFTADWKRKGVSNEKLRRLQQIARCRVQIAKSFKTQGPPLPWFLSDLNLRNFYIAASLRQRLTVQWFFIGLQRDFDDSGTRRVIGTNPSRFWMIITSDWFVWERYSSIRNFPPPRAGDISPNQRCKLAGHSSG